MFCFVLLIVKIQFLHLPARRWSCNRSSCVTAKEHCCLYLKVTSQIWPILRASSQLRPKTQILSFLQAWRVCNNNCILSTDRKSYCSTRLSSIASRTTPWSSSLFSGAILQVFAVCLPIILFFDGTTVHCK